MSIKFKTAYHLPASTAFLDIKIVEVEVNDEHQAEAEAALKVGAPTLSNMVKIGLQDGWITIV